MMTVERWEAVGGKTCDKDEASGFAVVVSGSKCTVSTCGLGTESGDA
jgi:hypothetical protein